MRLFHGFREEKYYFLGAEGKEGKDSWNEESWQTSRRRQHFL